MLAIKKKNSWETSVCQCELLFSPGDAGNWQTDSSFSTDFEGDVSEYIWLTSALVKHEEEQGHKLRRCQCPLSGGQHFEHKGAGWAESTWSSQRQAHKSFNSRVLHMQRQQINIVWEDEFNLYVGVKFFHCYLYSSVISRLSEFIG